MFFFLSKTLDLFLSPYTWGLLLLAAAIPWRKSNAERWRSRRLLGLTGLLVLLLASSEPVANALQWRLDHAAQSTYRADETYDAVILLGGVTDGRVMAATGEVAFNDAIERAVRVHELLRDGKARFAIISGAEYDPSLRKFGEAVVVARQLTAWGIDPSRIIVEDKARNTRENAVYSKEIVDARGFKRVLIVTSAAHMPRSLECFNAVGLPVDALLVDYRAHDWGMTLGGVLPRPYALSQTTSVLRELFGRYVYRARGYGKARLE